MRDQLNRTLHLKEIPKRIVSLVPSQTELLCDLGLESALVGVTKFCVHPHHIRTYATVVGGTKQIHLEKIKALHPDIILCNKEENTKAIVDMCQDICPIHVSDIYSVEDSLELIKMYGKIFNKAHVAHSIIKRINSEKDVFENEAKVYSNFKTVYFIWKNPWMVAGSNTYIDYMMHLNKFENVFKNLERYPEINFSKPEINKGVELVLLSSEPYPFKMKHQMELQEVYPNAKIVLVDGEMFSWYGSRLIKAFPYFKTLGSSLHHSQP
ncbi:ABC transporter substrate-binding protein [Changchengzhania lutea]|uniref:ABC transporter substrate-binding protein n=1 Tax=Changchengzhania lutea TaxID=2049305 RepID=UPI00115CAAA4|nr:helical backbone metal receptor [Changchengzhania lutea]